MNLREWIEAQNFKFQKGNERPWGTYDLRISVDDGKTWLDLGRSFGWGFTEKDALEIALKDVRHDSKFHPSLIQWLGQEKFEELIKIEEKNV